MITLEFIITSIVTGFAVGVGSAIANYLVQKSIIAKLEKLDKKLEERKRNE